MAFKLNFCPVCRGKNLLLSKNSLVHCRRCSTRFLGKLPPKSEIEKTLEADAKKIINKLPDSKTEKICFQRINYLSSFTAVGANLLDVGCGNGIFLKLAQKAGFKSFGLDKSKTIVRHLKTRGFKVYQNFPELKSCQFDVVTAFDVIEHTSNPLNFLLKLKNQLKPGGTLMLTTPNGNGLGGQTLKNRFWGLNPAGHWTIFNPHSLKLILKKAGFNVLEIKTDIICWWYLTNSPLINRLFNKILYLLLKPFARFLFSQNLGDNLQVLAQNRLAPRKIDLKNKLTHKQFRQ